jgi:hypothetical protein
MNGFCVEAPTPGPLPIYEKQLITITSIKKLTSVQYYKNNAIIKNTEIFCQALEQQINE